MSTTVIKKHQIIIQTQADPVKIYNDYVITTFITKHFNQKMFWCVLLFAILKLTTIEL